MAGAAGPRGWVLRAVSSGGWFFKRRSRAIAPGRRVFTVFVGRHARNLDRKSRELLWAFVD